MMDSKVYEKIQKLLELATSPNEHEAKSAMEFARKLMLQYNINNFQRQITTLVANYPKQSTIPTFPRIVNVLVRVFGCGVTYSKECNIVEIYGFADNIKVAEYAIEMVCNQALVDYRAEYAKYRSLSFREGFWQGFANGLYAKFKGDMMASKAAEEYKPVWDFMARFNFDKSAQSTTDAAGVLVGSTFGANATIRRGVGSVNTGRVIA
jgi:hypothetical protein